MGKKKNKIIPQNVGKNSLLEPEYQEKVISSTSSQNEDISEGTEKIEKPDLIKSPTQIVEGLVVGNPADSDSPETYNIIGDKEYSTEHIILGAFNELKITEAQWNAFSESKRCELIEKYIDFLVEEYLKEEEKNIEKTPAFDEKNDSPVLTVTGEKKDSENEPKRFFLVTKKKSPCRGIHYKGKTHILGRRFEAGLEIDDSVAKRFENSKYFDVVTKEEYEQGHLECKNERRKKCQELNKKKDPQLSRTQLEKTRAERAKAILEGRKQKEEEKKKDRKLKIKIKDGKEQKIER